MAATYCKGCGLDKLFLGDDDQCDECRWLAIETGVEPNGKVEGDIQSLRFISLAGRKPKPVRWLWDGRIPLGVGTLLVGIPGGGKTHVALHLAARLTRGTLPGYFFQEPSAVVVMSREDMLDETIVPRLMAECADMDRVFALPFASGSFSVEHDMPELEALVAKESIRMVVLDPMLAFLTGDTFKESEVRRMLESAQRLMEEHKIAIVGIAHLNKDVMKDLLSRVTSSGAFTAIVRSILFVGSDPDDDDELNPSKILAHGKSNLSKIAPSIGFRMVEQDVVGEDENGEEIEITTSRLDLIGESEVTAEQLVKGRGSAGTKLAQAEGLLLRLCAGGKGVGKQTALTEAERLGISARTLERAFQHLGGIAGDQERDPDTGKLGSAVWRLPQTARQRGW